MSRRIERINSLLREVISEVLTKDLHHIRGKSEFVTITSVSMTADGRSATVFLSVLGDDAAKKATCAALNRLAPLIGRCAGRKVRLRIFPHLVFAMDEGLEQQLKICELLAKVMPNDAPSGEDSA